MVKITLKPRTGKDFFEYLETAETSRDRANENALMDFVLVDGEELTIEQLTKIKPEALAILKSKVFTLKVKGVVEEDETVNYGNYKIKKKKLRNDFIENLQLKIQKLQEKGNFSTTDLVRTSIKEFYEVEKSDLEVMPYEISAYLFDRINEFFRKSSSYENEFLLDDLWLEDT